MSDSHAHGLRGEAASGPTRKWACRHCGSTFAHHRDLAAHSACHKPEQDLLQNCTVNCNPPAVHVHEPALNSVQHARQRLTGVLQEQVVRLRTEWQRSQDEEERQDLWGLLEETLKALGRAERREEQVA